MADALCCASPRRKAGGVPTGPLGSASTKIKHDHSARSSGDDADADADLSLGGRALSLFGGKPKKKPAKVDAEDDGEIGFGDRALSLFGGGKPKKKDEETLPLNWKKAKDKDGKVYYFNSVTQVRQEALHKDSGRVYYMHKATRKTTFTFPEASEADDDADELEEDKKEDGLLSKSLSFFQGKKKKDDDLERSSSISKSDRTATLAKKDKKDGAAAGTAKKETTVFISCTTLIKEVKLCVDEKQHATLEALLEKLVNRKIAAEEAVKHLQALVGTTLVQQAGMSVKNAKTGVLPHGWLEYTDERSGRPYYFNVHTRTTTWYKPKKDDISDAAKAADFLRAPSGASKGSAAAETDSEVKLDFDVKTHTVAMSGFI